MMYDPFGSGFNMMFNIIPFIVMGGFVLVFGIIIVRAVQGAAQWNKNNHSPKLTVEATVVAKRTHVSHNSHHHGTDTMHHSSSSTSYFVTFEVESGDRMEFAIKGSEFGVLVEGDEGKLSFQGTRYEGFERRV